MSEHIATANTIGELIDTLQKLIDERQVPEDFPVRVQSMSHTWSPEVQLHERCVLLAF